ncbi:methionyl-tRNA formyltransferase [Legionella spiritensis]|uniref:methionyl-tRNA formyltransferase n=1 Tax=Legionella spiritensis TaxID=452 RepID=UPI000F6DBE24|nr:methionyl-tRNA formyltransferase [Legionella spiritensis]VEG91302.1 methionyl-tRNA formyltransferase [Legionella spiritensis]
MTRLKIVFAGTPEFGIPCLNDIHNSRHQLLAVYTQPDRPAGRGRKLQPSAVKSWAIEHNIPVYQPVNFKNPAAVEELAALKPDLLVVIAYGLILPASVLATPSLGCINVHASLLPRWRGASPIQQAILHGDEQSGVTIMQMDAGLDTGDCLIKRSCHIDAQDTAGMLHDKLAALAPEALMTALDSLAQGTLKRHPQDNSRATYAGKISKTDARIDWRQPAQVIERQVRAFNPWPVAHTFLDEEPLRVYQSETDAGDSMAEPGTILAIDKEGMLVATGTGRLRIRMLQFPGGKAMTVAQWLNAGRAQQLVGMVLR